MWWFQPAMVWWVSWPFEILIAPEKTEILWTDNFSVVKLK
jgi:hypothetical protein